MSQAPPPPLPRLCLGVTGHRVNNPAFAANRAAVEAQVRAVLLHIDAAAASEGQSLGKLGRTRLHSLLANGVDQLAAAIAVELDWDVAAPLPFGRRLNMAVNAFPKSAADAGALLSAKPVDDAETADLAQAIAASYEGARIFELAEDDEKLAALFIAHLGDPQNPALAQAWHGECSTRAQAAGRIMIEQSDLVIAVWDGAAHNLPGGTGHTIVAALQANTPVIWIDPARPGAWRVLRRVEELTNRAADAGAQDDALAQIVRAALRPGEGGAYLRGTQALGSEAWHARSPRFWTFYRRIEALFGGVGNPFRRLKRVYETPDAIAAGRCTPVMAAAYRLAAGDAGFVDGIGMTLRRFAWAEGISARLSDFYRSGMMANFALSALAVAAGLMYQPLHLDGSKLWFALGEFILLILIVMIIWRGRRRRWHQRWFETRRVAEYFRHAPYVQMLGVARPAGLWPRGGDTNWPEYYARHGLRETGLPHLSLDRAILRAGLAALRDEHLRPQLAYHREKAGILHRVHHRLDTLSAWLFVAAVLGVATWLGLKFGGLAGLWPIGWSAESAKTFTFIGVMCPTFGAAIAGMRYFGDFERFAGLSHHTADRLAQLDDRMGHLLAAPEAAVS
ncbi:MAG: hypothetical protein ACKOPO_12755, partial [Novosphingobium sp.]